MGYALQVGACIAFTLLIILPFFFVAFKVYLSCPYQTPNSVAVRVTFLQLQHWPRARVS